MSDNLNTTTRKRKAPTGNRGRGRGKNNQVVVRQPEYNPVLRNYQEQILAEQQKALRQIDELSYKLDYQFRWYRMLLVAARCLKRMGKHEHHLG